MAFPCAENDRNYLQGLRLEPVHRDGLGSEAGNDFPLYPQTKSKSSPRMAILDDYSSLFQEFYGRPTSPSAVVDSSYSLSPPQSIISSPPLPRCGVDQTPVGVDTNSVFKCEPGDRTHRRVR